jgi:BirA family biotin operon repressor/biotin-[acetyl-CoA-carboxylase] ligase
LDQQVLNRSLVELAVPWREVTVVASTGSTNADALRAVAAGAPEGWALTTDEQVAGRGRLARSWQSPPGAGIALSVVLRPAVPAHRWGWLPLMAGVAAATALSAFVPGGVWLKWPNDVVVRRGPQDLAKLAGILVERAPGADPAVVVGIGVNVGLTAAELPGAAATSVLLCSGTAPRREPVIAALLAELHARYTKLASFGGDPVASGLREAYRRRSATLGRPVRLSLPADTTVEGVAVDLDDQGRLLIDGPGGPRAFAAGDVVTTRSRGPAAR